MRASCHAYHCAQIMPLYGFAPEDYRSKSTKRLLQTAKAEVDRKTNIDMKRATAEKKRAGGLRPLQLRLNLCGDGDLCGDD